jgi:hypothetical protein
MDHWSLEHSVDLMGCPGEKVYENNSSGLAQVRMGDLVVTVERWHILIEVIFYCQRVILSILVSKIPLWLTDEINLW